MAFTTQRGRPRKPVTHDDPGTPELRFKHAHGITAEPIDLCLEKQLISEAQHRSALHLRWLYTLRYGAPSLTTHYGDKVAGSGVEQDPAWRALREREYQQAVQLLKTHRRYECVMRLSVYNELPIFLSRRLQQQAWQKAAMAERLHLAHIHIVEGLQLLVTHWKRNH